MDLHVELLDQHDRNNTLLLTKRVMTTVQHDIDVTDPNSWGFIGSAYCLYLPLIEGYSHLPHITVEYFGGYVITKRNVGSSNFNIS